MLEGAVNCLALHKDGLYAAGEDGTLRLIEMTGDHALVKASYMIGAPISAMSWNSPHTALTLGSTRVRQSTFFESVTKKSPDILHIHSSLSHLLHSMIVEERVEKCEGRMISFW